MLDKVSDFVLSFSKNLWMSRIQRALWDANFYKKKTYGLRVIKLLVLGPNLGSQKTFYF